MVVSLARTCIWRLAPGLRLASHYCMTMTEIDRLLERCPSLSRLPRAMWDSVATGLSPIEIPSQTTVFDSGQPCQTLPILLEGSIRVFKRSPSGREISLYRVLPGEFCIVTVSCLLSGDHYPANGVTEQPVIALTLPRPLFLQLTGAHPPFREAVFHLFGERLAGLMRLVDEVAFMRLDQRLAGLLTARAPLIQDSHQQIADELGSVREIISRLLKQFESRGWISLARKRIEVLDRNALLLFAESAR
jgi:CRP/FNR family transcriptional regulator, anaerobic regulatory protein